MRRERVTQATVRRRRARAADAQNTKTWRRRADQRSRRTGTNERRRRQATATSARASWRCLRRRRKPRMPGRHGDIEKEPAARLRQMGFCQGGRHRAPSQATSCRTADLDRRALVLERHVESYCRTTRKATFAWHADSKPDDGKMRTQPRTCPVLSDRFRGRRAPSRLGERGRDKDARRCPAALPHKGPRRAKAKALHAREATRQQSIEGYWAAALHGLRTTRARVGRRVELHCDRERGCRARRKTRSRLRVLGLRSQSAQRRRGPQYARVVASMTTAEKPRRRKIYTAVVRGRPPAAIWRPGRAGSSSVRRESSRSTAAGRRVEIAPRPHLLLARRRAPAPRAAPERACLSLVHARGRIEIGGARRRARPLNRPAPTRGSASSVLEGLRGDGGTCFMAPSPPEGQAEAFRDRRGRRCCCVMPDRAARRGHASRGPAPRVARAWRAQVHLRALSGQDLAQAQSLSDVAAIAARSHRRTLETSDSRCCAAFRSRIRSVSSDPPAAGQQRTHATHDTRGGPATQYSRRVDD